MDMIMNEAIIEKLIRDVIVETLEELELSYKQPTGCEERTTLENRGRVGTFKYKLCENIKKELGNTDVGMDLVWGDKKTIFEIHLNEGLDIIDFGSSNYDLTVKVNIGKDKEILVGINGLMEEYLIQRLPSIDYLVYETEGYPIRPATLEKYITDRDYRERFEIDSVQPTVEEVKIITIVENFFGVILKPNLTFEDVGNILIEAADSSIYRLYLLPTIEILAIFLKDNRKLKSGNMKVKISLTEEVLVEEDRESYLQLLKELNKTELINGRLSTMY